MGEEEHAGTGVIKLATVVALNNLNGGAELSTNIAKKMRQSRKGVRFQFQRERPQKMRAIIKNDQIIFKARDTNDGRRPQITVNEIKLASGTRL
jgi:hypothetical protein